MSRGFGGSRGFGSQGGAASGSGGSPYGARAGGGFGGGGGGFGGRAQQVPQIPGTAYDGAPRYAPSQQVSATSPNKRGGQSTATIISLAGCGQCDMEKDADKKVAPWNASCPHSPFPNFTLEEHRLMDYIFVGKLDPAIYPEGAEALSSIGPAVQQTQAQGGQNLSVSPYGRGSPQQRGFGSPQQSRGGFGNRQGSFSTPNQQQRPGFGSAGRSPGSGFGSGNRAGGFGQNAGGFGSSQRAGFGGGGGNKFGGSKGGSFGQNRGSNFGGQGGAKSSFGQKGNALGGGGQGGSRFGQRGAAGGSSFGSRQASPQGAVVAPQIILQQPPLPPAQKAPADVPEYAYTAHGSTTRRAAPPKHEVTTSALDGSGTRPVRSLSKPRMIAIPSARRYGTDTTPRHGGAMRKTDIFLLKEGASSEPSFDAMAKLVQSPAPKLRDDDVAKSWKHQVPGKENILLNDGDRSAGPFKTSSWVRGQEEKQRIGRAEALGDPFPDVAAAAAAAPDVTAPAAAAKEQVPGQLCFDVAAEYIVRCFWGEQEIEGADKIHACAGYKIENALTDLSIEHPMLGRIEWRGPIDTSEKATLKDMVILEKGCVDVYPDAWVKVHGKPPQQTGLNRRCKITYYSMFPKNTSKEGWANKYAAKFRGWCENQGKEGKPTTFESYDETMGILKFAVEHFTKYKFIDDDEEEEEDVASPEAKAVGAGDNDALVVSLDTSMDEDDEDDDDDDDSEGSGGSSKAESDYSTGDISEGENDDVEEGNTDTAMLEDDVPAPDATANDTALSALPGLTLGDLDATAMAASISTYDFHSAKPSATRAPRQWNEQFPAREVFDDSLALEMAVPAMPLRRPAMQPPAVQLKAKPADIAAVLPKTPDNERMQSNQRTDCFVDSGLVLGRSFRAGWGPRGLIVMPGVHRGGGSFHRSIEVAKIGVTPAKSLSGESPRAQRVYDAAVRTHLSQSEVRHQPRAMDDDEPSCPWWQLKAPPANVPRDQGLLLSSVAAAKGHVERLDELIELYGTEAEALGLQHDVAAWALFDALWGSPELSASDLTERGVSTRSTAYEEVVYRRRQVTAWLRDTVDVKMARERVRLVDELNPDRENGLLDVLDALSRGKIDKACEVARKMKDYKLAMVLAQTPGDADVRALMRGQLALWRLPPSHQPGREANSMRAVTQSQARDDDRARSADIHINRNRLRLYALVAGQMAWPESNVALALPSAADRRMAFKVCHELDWKRAFALHFWYTCDPSASLADGVTAYDRAWQSAETPLASYPFPPYEGAGAEPDPENSKDITYHMLKLYCNSSHSVAAALAPPSSSSCALDYRMSWLMYGPLRVAGVPRLPLHVEEGLHVSFAMQLESVGLWHYAVFVLSHIEGPDMREWAIRETLDRNCTHSGHPASENDKRAFVVDCLGVPAMWCDLAATLRARVERADRDLAALLIRCERWRAAHTVLIDGTIREAILMDKLDDVIAILGPFQEHDESGLSSAGADRLRDFRQAHEWPKLGQIFLRYAQLMRSRLRLVPDKIERSGDDLTAEEEVRNHLFNCGFRAVPIEVFRLVQEDYLYRRANDHVADEDVRAMTETAIRDHIGQRNNRLDELSQGVCNLGIELERIRAAEIVDLMGDEGLEVRRKYHSECKRDRHCLAYMVEELTRYQLDMAAEGMSRDARLRRLVNVPPPNDGNTALHASSSRHRLKMLTDMAAQMTLTI
mmetsp:Transcript_19490/g.50706  ORF Transcript_19490/g.50706 Transcript_19490/m.50706 type:complete len:1705 (+) Transcript_19490:177-5291(+)